MPEPGAAWVARPTGPKSTKAVPVRFTERKASKVTEPGAVANGMYSNLRVSVFQNLP